MAQVPPRRRQWHPTLVLLPGKSHGWRILVGCSPWGRKESDTTEWLHFHFSLSCIGEGNGNPVLLPGRIPGAGEPGGLLSMGSHRVGHYWSDLVAAAAASRLSQRSTLGWKSLWSPRQFWGSWTAMSKRIMVNSYLPTREKINSKCITDLNIKANGIQH